VGPVSVKALGLDAPTSRRVASVGLVGSDDPVHWAQTGDALTVEAPARLPCEDVIAYRVAFE
jgi:hypothetical protein